MKKCVIVLLAIVMCFPSVKAQKGEQEISVNYSMFSTTAMFAVLSNIMGSIVTFGIYQPYDIKNSADFGVTYRYNLSNKFSLGASAMYMNNSYTATLAGNKEKPLGTGITHFYKFSAEGKLNYFKSDWVSCYGLLGLGFDLINVKYSPNPAWIDQNASNEPNVQEIRKEQGNTFPWPNFQFTPIGVSVGKDFGGFMDLGVGYKGILNLGVYYRF